MGEYNGFSVFGASGELAGGGGEVPGKAPGRRHPQRHGAAQQEGGGAQTRPGRASPVRAEAADRGEALQGPEVLQEPSGSKGDGATEVGWTNKTIFVFSFFLKYLKA